MDSLSSSIQQKNAFNLKLVLGDEIRIIPRAPNNMAALHETIIRTFKERAPSAYTLSYLDSDGDRINLDLDEDLEALYELNTGKKTIKIEIASVGQDYEFIKKLEESKPVKLNEEVVIVSEQLPEIIEKIEEKKANKILEVDTDLKRSLVKEEKHGLSPSIFELSDKSKILNEKPLINDGSYCFSFNRDVKVLPERITVSNSAFIYFSMSIKNCGLLDFPKKLRFLNVSDSLRGEAVPVLPLKVGEDTSLTLVLENPKVAGEFVAYWELKTAKEEVIGNIVHPFEVIDDRVQVPEKPKYGVIKAKPKPNYQPEVVEKAKVVQRIFGGDLQKYKDLIASKNYFHINEIIDDLLEQEKALELFNKKK